MTIRAEAVKSYESEDPQAKNYQVDIYINEENIGKAAGLTKTDAETVRDLINTIK